MKQKEIFSFLADQTWIENYKWYQETLENFKENNKICLEQKSNFKKHNKSFKELLGNKNYCQFMVKKHIKDTQESIDSSERTLLKIETNITYLNDILRRVDFNYSNDKKIV